jgi:hypothetical protein
MFTTQAGEALLTFHPRMTAGYRQKLSYRREFSYAKDAK